VVAIHRIAQAVRTRSFTKQGENAKNKLWVFPNSSSFYPFFLFVSSYNTFKFRIEKKNPEGETPDGETPDGETPDGETPDGVVLVGR